MSQVPERSHSNDVKQAGKLGRNELLLRQMSLASQSANSTSPTDEVISLFLSLGLSSLAADMGMVMLANEMERSLRLHACIPPLLPDEVEMAGLTQQSWDFLQALAAGGQRTELASHAQHYFRVPDEHQYQNVLIAPLVQDARFLGLLCCYFRTSLPPTEGQIFLEGLANLLAVTLRQRQLQYFFEMDRESLVKAFFDDLRQSEHTPIATLQSQAEFLGYDLSRPYTVMMGLINVINGKDSSVQALQREVRTLVAQVRHRIEQNLPGSLVYGHDGVLIGLLSPHRDTAVHLKAWLFELSRQIIKQNNAIRLSIGITYASETLHDYRQRFAEASQALQTSLSYQVRGGVVHFNEVLMYYYLHEMPEMAGYLTGYEEKIVQLVERGGHKADLISTLEAFLDTGTVGKTTAYLREQHASTISPTTVRQRLKRVGVLLGVDLFGKQMTQQRFNLHLAVKANRLQQEGKRTS